MNKLPHWVHIIGICGSATSAIAVMFKNAGVKVTGSDKGFFPPVSSYLINSGIEIGVGYKSDRLTSEGNHPDFVIVQGLKPNNPEIIEAQRLNIPVKNFTEVLTEYVIVENSIVVAGTYGKTTITAMVVEILTNAGIEVSYMFGGVPKQFSPNANIKVENTKYSVLEGDEYMTSLEDKKSKFFHYHAKYLILNSCKWEHPDLFHTESSYIENFKLLIRNLPSDGVIIANANDKNVCEIVKEARCDVVYYSVDRELSCVKPNWFLDKTTKPLPTFIKWNEVSGEIEVVPFSHKLIGNFNEENFLAATALVSELGIKKERIQDGIEEFTGIKRRLEIIAQTDDLLLIDDFGSSPPKAKGSLEAIREDYPDSEITAVFEPNTGNRTIESIVTYKNCFDLADKIIFPRFTKLPKTNYRRLDHYELKNKLKGEYPNIEVIDNDDVLIKQLSQKSDKHKVVVFMGSHGFRGMIDQLKILLGVNDGK